MQRLYQLEPGFESRITRTIDFPDYSIDELVQIFDRELAARRVCVVGGKLEGIHYLIGNELSGILDERGPRNFGNARGIRNIVERLMDEHSVRVYEERLHGDASNDIDFRTVVKVMRTMYSNHPGDDFDLTLSKYAQSKMRQWLDNLEQLVAQAKKTVASAHR